CLRTIKINRTPKISRLIRTNQTTPRTHRRAGAISPTDKLKTKLVGSKLGGAERRPFFPCGSLAQSATPQPIGDQAALPFGYHLTVVYNFAPAAMALEHNLPVMKRLQFRTMAHADNGCCRQFPRQKFHQVVLAFRIECRCCFIKHDDIGSMQENTRESQSLFFSA